MRKAADPLLWIETSPRRGMALVRGDEAERITGLVSRAKPQWSRSGNGWVIPIEVVDDLRCYAWRIRDFVIVYCREA